jgi:proton-translocating NADH-quinone oxidoreductase chain L
LAEWVDAVNLSLLFLKSVGSSPSKSYIMLFFYIFFPLVNFFYAWIVGWILGEKSWATLLVTHSYVLNVILGIWGFWKVCILGQVQYVTVGTWINCGLFVVNWGFIFDSLAICMLLMVSLISGSVHYYSLGYMDVDSCIVKFMSYLSLFTFFMFILVSADNFVQLFLGWEGIGLCSYLLISFWNTRIQANKAALQALIMNRVGDFGFICGFLLIFYLFKTVDFSIVFVMIPFYIGTTISIMGFGIPYLDLICIFLFIGSMGKSAQVGLHTWLPSAMEGPTPVSALIHAATLVTAGVFLIIRCSPIFEYAPTVLFFIMLIGGTTAFFAATIAITQNDIKKVIAYSTCSQLGYMVFICGLSSYDASIFHLVNHAFFKALLFLGAGSVIHAVSGEQDMRKYGGLINLIPYTYSTMLIGFFALSGFPFLSGFYSKDLILEIAFSKYIISGIFVYWLGTFSACLTAFYSFRVVVLTFWGQNLGYKSCIQRVHELPYSMALSLGILVVGSLFSGYFLRDAFVGIGTTFWGNAIYISSHNSIGFDMDFIPITIKTIPLAFSFLGTLLAIFWNFFWEYTKNSALLYIKNSNPHNNVYNYPQSLVYFIRFLNKKWYFDYIYNYYIGYSVLTHGFSSFYKLIDKSFLEICGPQGLSHTIYKITVVVSHQQSGYLYHLGCLLLLWLIVLTYLSVLL